MQESHFNNVSLFVFNFEKRGLISNVVEDLKKSPKEKLF